MKKYFSTFFALFCFVLLVVCTGVSVNESSLSSAFCSDVLRFHIIANSDSYEDQDLKYRVRDGIAPLVEKLFCECSTKDEAYRIAKENRAVLENAAQEVLSQCGSSQAVRAYVGKQRYPRKTLDGIVFPEGEYLSLRLVIGDGNGRNWWGVLFPSFLDTGVKQENNPANDGGIEIFGCRIKLKILEYFE